MIRQIIMVHSLHGYSNSTKDNPCEYRSLNSLPRRTVPEKKYRRSNFKTLNGFISNVFQSWGGAPHLKFLCINLSN